MVYYVNRSGRLRTTSEPQGINAYRRTKKTVKRKGVVASANKKTDNNEYTFVNPLTDYGWKKIVACPRCKESMNSLLGAILEKDLDVRKLHFRNQEVKGSTGDSKDVIFDSYCSYKEKGVDSRTNGVNDDMHFIVEMQRQRHVNFVKRLVYYQISLMESLSLKGKKWNFNLPNVFTVCFLDFEMYPDEPEYIHFCDLTRGIRSQKFTDVHNYIIIELPKFNKTEDQLETSLDKWLYMLKNMRHLDKVPKTLNNGIFKTIFERARIANFNKNQKAMYNRAELKAIEYESTLQYKKQEGKAEGILEGKVEGKAEGILEEKARLKKGYVLSLLQKTNLSHADISESLGVSLDFVEKMNDSLMDLV